jgi:hypothetical protein
MHACDRSGELATPGSCRPGRATSLPVRRSARCLAGGSAHDISARRLPPSGAMASQARAARAVSGGHVCLIVTARTDARWRTRELARRSRSFVVRLTAGGHSR